MANQDRVNFVWAESALTTIPPIPVSEVAYRDTTQTPEQMEVGQQYDTIYNSARHNQLLFLLTSVAKTLCENGIMPFLAGQEYSQYARCIFTDGKLYTASRAILANEQPYPTPGDDSGVWIAEETSENLVPNSRRVIAGTGLTGGGPLSSDVTLSAKLDGKTTQAAAGGVITVKDVAIGGDLGDLASARGQIGNAVIVGTVDFNTLVKQGVYSPAANSTNGPNWSGQQVIVVYQRNVANKGRRVVQYAFNTTTNAAAMRIGLFTTGTEETPTSWSNWTKIISENSIGDGIRNTNGIISVPEYEGATASTAGTSGLVPPAAAGQQESFLTGGGKYKPALGFTPVQQGGGTGQGNNKVYIGWATDASGLKAQADSTNLGNIVTTEGGTVKAPQAALADRAQVANTSETLFVTGWGNTRWGSTPYMASPLYLWCLPTGGSDMRPCSPSVLSVFSTEVTPNVRVGIDGSVLPPKGTWRCITSRNGEGEIFDLAGGSVVQTKGGVFMAIKVA